MGISSDTLANIAAAAMCLVVTYAVAERYILAKPASTPAVSGYRPGDDFVRDSGRTGHWTIGTVRGRSRQQQLPLLCRRARHSIVNWQRFKKLQRRKFQTVFLGISGASDAETFVSVHHLEARSVLATPKNVRAKIPGTPTLILVDENGRVSSSWAGKLSAADEKLSALHGLAARSSVLIGQDRSLI